MVTSLCLLELLLVLCKLLLSSKSHAVDTGEHLVLCIILPVSTALSGDLEGLKCLGITDMRSDTHIDVIALLIEADHSVIRQITDMLLLIFCASLVHEFYCFLTTENEGLEGKVLLRDLFHLRLDSCEILIGKLLIAEVYIVIKASLGCGTIGKIWLGI